MVVPVIPRQREFRSNTAKPFNDLISYLEGEPELARPGSEIANTNPTECSVFNDVIDYAMDSAAHGDKCLAVRTHGVISRETAAIEMNAVSRKNPRCKDPVYHFILSWPEHERPAAPAIFEAATHAIRALGLAEHQYIVAIHDNTDNRHCHIAVNRVHPITFKSQNIEWAKRTLHYAAREIEIQQGWTHDNGIYIVRLDGQGRKRIVLHPDHAQTNDGLSAGRDHVQDTRLPAWHDPDSLQAWLRKTVSKALKRDLPELGSWHALHVWLAAWGITLSDTGGGGLRLQATSRDTGEILDLPASRAIRSLKRAELETRWGPFSTLVPIQVAPTDLSHLSPQLLIEGALHVINNSLDRGVPPPDHLLRLEDAPEGAVATESRGLHDMSDGHLADRWGSTEMPLPSAVSTGLGNSETGEDHRVRRAGDAEGPSREDGDGLTSRARQARDPAARETRRLQRQAQRLDLRQRYSHYRRLARSGNSDYFLQVQHLRATRSHALKAVKSAARSAKSSVPKSWDSETRLLTILQIEAGALQQQTSHEAQYQAALSELRQRRTQPMGWRTWLTHQAELGDQAALSALRGIVYQARRNAHHHYAEDAATQPTPNATEAEQFKATMGMLLEEERQELAIRAASVRMMRPHEVDALLLRHAGTRWRVTGNGNVEYQDVEGSHLFTDRANRITFDRVYVSDEDIRLALLHAKSKFGDQLTLTGPDAIFSLRMARLADDMGIRVLNPELQDQLEQHRLTRANDATTPQELQRASATPTDAPPSPEVAISIEEAIRSRVLAIDPAANFSKPKTGAGERNVGPVVQVYKTGGDAVFAQHVGRGVYVIHHGEPPPNHDGQPIDVEYAKTGMEVRLTHAHQGQDRR